jgi:hypothetical protein
MRVLVTGSTSWTDPDPIRREFADLPPGTTALHGDCVVVDALAGEVARLLGSTVERWEKLPADFRRYGRAAWKGLNERMLASGVNLVIAFHPDWNVQGRARGTRHTMQLAEAAGAELHAFAR